MKTEEYIKEHINELHELIEELVKIPSPSHFEDNKAKFVKKWLEDAGAEGVYIDDAKNCVFPINCEKDDIVVFEAHTDTVFPDLTPFEMKKCGNRFCAPGIGDDTACLAIMLLTVKYILQEKLVPNCGILFVANSCEEGLGNLDGTRMIMKTYGEKIRRFYTFDGVYDYLIDRCVGSHRYEVTVKTKGGHSYNAFGSTNAIAELSKLIASIYKTEVPKKEGTKTTYNVGVIEGGTSVNTIAQNAKMLFEYRSDDAECIEIMQKKFEDLIEKANEAEDAEFSVKPVGIRPCGNIKDRKTMDEMTAHAISVCEKITGIPCKRVSGSTDCNIPASLGIPSLCIGTFSGSGAHTREEYIEVDSLPAGMKISFEIILKYFE